MKKLLVIFSLISFGFLIQGCGPSYVATERPVAYSRPAPPRPGYIWVEGSWYRSGGRYIQRPGYWAPPKKNKVYKPGTWYQQNNSWKYKKGGWKRH
jgi:hypothetical protein